MLRRSRGKYLGIKEELGFALLGPYAELYKQYREEEGILDDGKLTVDEIDCSDPISTLREPLPATGTHPQALVTSGNSYWKCEISDKRYHADGRVSGNFTNNNQDIWNVCNVGHARLLFQESGMLQH